MIKKIALVVLFALIAGHSLFAQDKRDYRRERAELARQEKAEKKQHRIKEAEDYGTNIISIMPLSALDLGLGVGMSYEKIVGADKNIGIVLPVHFVFSRNDENNYNNYYGNSQTHTNTYFYFTPGIKIYPFGQRRVNFAFGPNLLIGGGSGTAYNYDYNNNVYSEYNVSKFRLGMLVNSYLNVQLTKSFYANAQIGLGILYVDRETDSNNGYAPQTYNNGMNVTGEFSFSLGYRF